MECRPSCRRTEGPGSTIFLQTFLALLRNGPSRFGRGRTGSGRNAIGPSFAQLRHLRLCPIISGQSRWAPLSTSRSTCTNPSRRTWCRDGPFEYLTVAGVRLPPVHDANDGRAALNCVLVLHSPIKFDQRLSNELMAIGTPRHLVSPNQFHYAHIGEWVKAFPEAITWASPRVRQRARARRIDIEFARDLGPIPPEGWVGKSTRRFSPVATSRRHLLPQGFKDADSHRHDF